MSKHLSRERDVVRLEVETKAKEPFLKAFKGDQNNMQLQVGPEVWNSLESLEKAAYAFHPDVKNLWKWVKKVHVHEASEPNFMRLYLFNLVFFLVTQNVDELDKWKKKLMESNPYYYPDCF